MTANTPDRDFTIIRVLETSPEQAFKAWTEPARFSQWFGPESFTTPVSRITMDLRPGGEWSAALVSPDGAEAVLGGVYREIAEPERLVFTTGDPDNQEGAVASVVTVTFTANGDTTEMNFNQAGYNTDEEHANGAKAGWLQFFDRLDKHLAGA
ncbi:SRPBCC domain-containing protein [Microbispora sp. NPDC049125]|uniref:SRPBCC family protein n=1 Tax=Microbispora sp. NPDC049125 TaxID=3154929 RepID=UPI003466FC93